jgi:hypothetical protein
MGLKTLLAVLMATVFALNVAACCGNGKTTTTEKKEIISAPTVGQQLEDLDKAYKTGSITKEEYEKLRKEVMDKAAQTK